MSLPGSQVVYPGLPSHPQHQLLKKLANPGYGFGGLMGIDMGSQAKAEAVSGQHATGSSQPIRLYRQLMSFDIWDLTLNAVVNNCVPTCA